MNIIRNTISKTMDPNMMQDAKQRRNSASLGPTMKAIYFEEYGSADVLRFGEQPRPEPGPRQVLIEVHACCVNPRDWLLREGRYIFKRFAGKPPIIPGSDVSGRVVQIGSAVSRWKVGDEVFGMKEFLGGMMGAYAEFVAIDERRLARRPRATSHTEAAGAPVAALTALRALSVGAKLRRGQHVAIVGASGGVGTFAVQIAKALGATVTAICSSRNAALVRDLGADAIFDYKRENFLDSPTEYDVVFDCIGRESLRKCSRSMTPNGIYITTIPSLATFAMAAGTRLRALLPGPSQRSAVVLVRSDGAQLGRIAKWMTEGQVRTAVDTVFPLAQAREAHLASRTFRTRGKLILRVKG